MGVYCDQTVHQGVDYWYADRAGIFGCGQYMGTCCDTWIDSVNGGVDNDLLALITFENTYPTTPQFDLNEVGTTLLGLEHQMGDWAPPHWQAGPGQSIYATLCADYIIEPIDCSGGCLTYAQIMGLWGARISECVCQATDWTIVKATCPGICLRDESEWYYKDETYYLSGPENEEVHGVRLYWIGDFYGFSYDLALYNICNLKVVEWTQDTECT